MEAPGDGLLTRPNTEMQFTDGFHRTDCHIYNNYYICTNSAVVHNIVLILNLPQGVCSKFAKDSPVPSQVVQKINMKCKT